MAYDGYSGPAGPVRFGLNAEVTFVAPATGSYYAVVFSADGTSGGSYLLSAQIGDA